MMLHTQERARDTQCPSHFLAQSIDLSVKPDESLTAQSVKHSPASLIESVWGGQRALEQLAVLLLLHMHAQPAHPAGYQPFLFVLAI